MPRLRQSTLALISLAVLASLAALPSFAQDRAVRRYGLFAGANYGGAERLTLRWAVSDARRMADVMTELGGIEPRDSYVLSEPRAVDLQEQLAHIGGRLQRERSAVARTEIVFYYSGHSDEYGLMLGDERFSYADLRVALSAVAADVSIAILDSCASGAFTRIKGGAFTQPFLVDEGSKVTGHAYLTSSSANEASQESDALGSSFFTHFLVSGLRGAADVSDDGLVTLDEAYHYAREQTLSRTIHTFAGPQTPSFDFQLTGTGSLVLTSIVEPDAAVMLDATLSGRLWITRQAGGIVAEVEKREGRVLTIALPAGSYVITLQGQDRNYQHQLVLQSGARSTVAARDFRVTLLDRNRIRGDQIVSAPVTVTVLPGVSLLGDDPDLVRLSLGVPVADAYRVQGAQAAALLAYAGEDLRGVQVSGIGGRVAGDLTGLQASGLFNVASGNTRAMQSAGLVNRVDGEAIGVQAAGLLNTAGAGFSGVQWAGISNLTFGTLSGAQLAGIYNRAGRVAGAQAGLVNTAGDVKGAQIGLVNVGTHVVGVQVGLVNVSQEMYGIPIGLVTIVEKGIHNTSFWREAEDRTWISRQNGSNMFYTVASVGIDKGEWRSIAGLAVAAGFGFRIERRPFYFDVDAGWKLVSEGDEALARVTSLFDPGLGASFPSGRLVVGVAIGGGLGAFIGASVDVQSSLSTDHIGYFSDPAGSIVVGSGDSPIRLFPKFVVGIRF